MSTDPFIRPRKVADPALRLVVIPHAGGSGVAYHQLARGLPADWEPLLLDLPGRGKRYTATPLEDMPALVGLVVDDIAAAHRDGVPLALFGHSLGAVIAFEASRALQERGGPPVWTGVSGRVAPDWGPGPALLDAGLSDAALMAQLAAVGGLPERVAELPEFQEQFLGLLRSDLRALAGYRPDPDRAALRGPLTVFFADDDPFAPPYTLTSWARETRGVLRRRAYQGGHFHFLDDFAPLTDALVRDVRDALRQQVGPSGELGTERRAHARAD